MRGQRQCGGIGRLGPADINKDIALEIFAKQAGRVGRKTRFFVGAPCWPVAQRWQRNGGIGLEVEVDFAGVEVEDPVDRIRITAVLNQAVAEAVGLEVLLTALEANPPAQQQGACCGLVLQAIRQDAPASEINLNVALGDKAIEALIEPLLVGEQVDDCLLYTSPSPRD